MSSPSPVASGVGTNLCGLAVGGLVQDVTTDTGIDSTDFDEIV
jgi:hypothetical protein